LLLCLGNQTVGLRTGETCRQRLSPVRSHRPLFGPLKGNAGPLAAPRALVVLRGEGRPVVAALWRRVHRHTVGQRALGGEGPDREAGVRVGLLRGRLPRDDGYGPRRGVGREVPAGRVGLGRGHGGRRGVVITCGLGGATCTTRGAMQKKALGHGVHTVQVTVHTRQRVYACVKCDARTHRSHMRRTVYVNINICYTHAKKRRDKFKLSTWDINMLYGIICS